MNYNKKNNIVPVIVVLVICAVALVFLFRKTPEYTSRRNIIAAENEFLKRDLDLIETDSFGNIDKDINDLESNIDTIVGGRNVNARNLKDSLSALCVDAGIESYEVVVGVPSTVQVAGEVAPALMSCEATITFRGEEGAGYGLIQGIEMNTESEYVIVSFDYAIDSETNLIGVGDWTIVVSVYYFEEPVNA